MDTAKELSMLEWNAKGSLARQYLSEPSWSRTRHPAAYRFKGFAGMALGETGMVVAGGRESTAIVDASTGELIPHELGGGIVT